MSEERFLAFGDAEALPVGEGKLLVYQPHTRKVALLRGADAQRFLACRDGGGGDRSALLSLEQRGVVVREAAIVERLLGAGGEAAPPRPLRRLGIVEGDGTERAAASWAAHAAAFGHSLTIIVTDVAAPPDRSSPAASRSVSLRQLDLAARRELALRLAAASGVSKDTATWAVAADGAACTGASRNALSLLHAGERFLVATGSVLAPPIRSPGARAGARLTSMSGPHELWPMAAMRRDPGEGAVDALVEVGRVLGVSVDVVLGGSDVAVHRAGGRFVRRVVEEGGRIGIAQLGVVGGVPAGPLLPLLLTGGASRDRLFADEDDFAAIITSGQLATGTDRLQLSDGLGRVSPAATALDGGMLQPPFPGAGRAEGAVFRQALSSTEPLVATLPALATMQPPSQGTSVEPRIASAQELCANELLAMLVVGAGIAADGARASETLALLGHTLADWADLPQEDFDELVRTALLRRRSAELQRAHAILERHDHEPPWWAMLVRRVTMALEASLPERELGTPSDMSREAFRRHVGDYGRLLVAWPALRDAASDLEERGGLDVAVEVPVV